MEYGIRGIIHNMLSPSHCKLLINPTVQSNKLMLVARCGFDIQSDRLWRSCLSHIGDYGNVSNMISLIERTVEKTVLIVL